LAKIILKGSIKFKSFKGINYCIDKLNMYDEECVQLLNKWYINKKIYHNNFIDPYYNDINKIDCQNVINELVDNLINNKILLKHIITEKEKKEEQERLKKAEEDRINNLNINEDNRKKAQCMEDNEKKNDELKTLITTKVRFNTKDKEELKEAETKEDILKYSQKILDRENELKELKKEKEWNTLNLEVKLTRSVEMNNIKEREKIDLNTYKNNFEDCIKNKLNIHKSQWKVNMEKKKRIKEIIGNDDISRYKGVLLVDNIPVTTEDKIEKLKSLINKKIKERTKINDIKILLRVSKSYFFIKHEKYEKIASLINKMAIDKHHTLDVIIGDNFKDILSISDTYEELKIEDKLNLPDSLYDYMDIYARSQFIVLQNDKLELYVNNYQTIGQNIPVIKDDIFINNINFSDFSKNGIYLYTICDECVNLYIEKLKFYTSFDVKNVISVIFSNDENLLLIRNNNGLYVYEIMTNKLIRKIRGEYIGNFSFDSKFIIAKKEDTLTIFCLESSKNLIIKNASNYSVSNSSNKLSYLSGIIIVIVDFSNDELVELNRKSVHFTEFVSFKWHSTNDYVACYIHRGKNNIFQIINTTIGSNIVTDTTNITEKVTCFEWNTDNKIAILVNNTLKIFNYNREIYSKVGKEYKQIVWNGKYILLSNLLFDSGIELLNIENKISKIIEYKDCTNIIIDPTKRFFVLQSSKYLNNKSNGFKIFTFQGDKIYEDDINNFYNFIWRPNLHSNLSHSETQKIKKSIRNNNDKQYNDMILEIKKHEFNILDSTSQNLTYTRIKMLMDYRKYNEDYK